MDYELTLTIKNAPLLNRMRERGYTSVARLAQDIGIGRSRLDLLARLECGVYGKDGVTPIPSVVRIAEFFNCTPEELAPASHVREPLRQAKFVAQVAEHQMAEIAQSAQDPIRLLEVFETESRDALSDMLDAMTGLNKRHRQVIELRFRDGKTLEECGEIMGVTRERIRQMLLKALRAMRHPQNQNDVVKAAGIYADNMGLSS